MHDVARAGAGSRDGRTMRSMDVELLVVPDCPHEQPAASLLRAALDDVGLAAVQFEVTVIASHEEAERRAFGGSPTILLNGDDPFQVPGQPASVACRIYPGGGGLPDPRALRQALKRAAVDRAPR